MTKAKWEDKVLTYLREHDGYFSIFYATENKFLANAFTRLEQSGRITTTPLGFPISHAIIKE